ncbi:MAG: type II secretion system protein [Verrucomicrobiota bacterium]
MLKSTLRKSLGFTLVELMIGLTLMGVIFTGAFSGMKTGLDIVEEARDQARATQLLQSEIERMRTLNWSDITNLPATESITLTGSASNTYNNRYNFERSITSLGTGRVRVSVTASWNNGQRDRSLSMTTGISENGLFDYYYRAF